MKKLILFLLLFSTVAFPASQRIKNKDIASDAAIALSKLAADTASRVACTSASGILQACTMPSSYLDATSSIQTQLNGKQDTLTTGNLTPGTGVSVTGGTGAVIGTGASVGLASIANNTILGNNSGSSAAPSALTGTQVTALLDSMVGDSGSGGTKGLVSAPAAGDAAAGKFWKADGTWAVPSGGGSSVQIEYGSFGGSTEATDCTGTPCTLYRNSSGIASVTRSGTGAYSVNFTGSPFSAAPTCFFTVRTNDAGYGVANTTTSTSAYTLQMYNAGATAVDTSLDFTCIGAP